MSIHTTPVVRSVMRGIALLIFKSSGWKSEGKAPALPRYVVIAAPHTSNWDFIYTLCLAFIYRLDPVIMMKDAWFRWPLGPVFRWLGALPIDRSKANHVVAQSVDQFNRQDRLVLVVPPSGTRKRVLYWKTGFYRIAHGAGVPIALGFLDYHRRVGGFGPTMRTTGDIDADMTAIRAFYRDVAGKYPLQESRQAIAPPVRPPVAG